MVLRLATRIALVCLLAAATGRAAAEEPAPDAAVQRSLNLLAKSAEEYTRQRDCFSCHHQALPAMTLALAKELGHAVPEDVIAHQAQFTAAFFRSRKMSLLNGRGVPGGPFTAGYALVTFEVAGRQPDEVSDALVAYLLKTQDGASGRWKIRTHRPPLEDSDFTATALAVRGLRAARGEHQTEAKGAVQAAVAWLQKGQPKSLEDRGFHLLGLAWADDKSPARGRAAKELVAEQADDGGWAQIESMKTDAYATGLALGALREHGLAPADEPFRRGVRFLRDRQKPDGSWEVKTRSKPIQTYFESGYPHEKNQFISISAASWATQAIMAAEAAKPVR